MSTMFKGAPKETTDYNIDGLQNFIGELEDRKNLLLEEPNSLLKQQAKLSKDLEEYENISATLEMQQNLTSIFLFQKLKLFSAGIYDKLF